MFRLAEEILLLVLDDEHGDLAGACPPRQLDLIVSAAVLMELALEGRIDTDPERLVLVDSTPLGDDLLDPTLAEIAADPDAGDTDVWLARIAEGARSAGGGIRDRAIARLIDAGVLVAEADSVFLSSVVSRSRRYPTRDGRMVEEARLRITRVLFSDEIPDPRDTLLICLADASGILRRLLTEVERVQLRDRIALLRDLELIGRSLHGAVRRHSESRESRRAAAPLDDLPEARGLPVLGSLLSMLGGKANRFLAGQYVELGPIFRVRALHRRLVVLAGPEATEFMKGRGRGHLRAVNGWHEFGQELGSSQQLMTLEGPPHARMRKALAPGYSPRLIQERLADFVHHTREELGSWVGRRRVCARLALQRMIARQTAVLLSDTSSIDHFEDVDRLVTTAVAVHVARTRPRLWMKDPRIPRARRRQRAMFEEIMAGREDSKRAGRTEDLVDGLLELHRSDPQFFPEENLPFWLTSSLPVSIHTTAFVTVFALHEAMKRPDLVQRMRAEADVLFGDGEPSWPTPAQIDVTRRFLMEVLRVYPMAPGTTRRVTNAFRFGGYLVPAGQDVMFAFAVTHVLPEHFPDPDRFDIERYGPERAEHRAPNVYTPFGAGAHSCLGKGLSEVQVALTLLAIFHELDLSPARPGYRLKVSYDPSLRPSDAFRFVARRRSGGPGAEHA